MKKKGWRTALEIFSKLETGLTCFLGLTGFRDYSCYKFGSIESFSNCHLRKWRWPKFWCYFFLFAIFEKVNFQNQPDRVRYFLLSFVGYVLCPILRTATDMDGTLQTDLWKSETSREIKNSFLHHLNISKSCIDFQN